MKESASSSNSLFASKEQSKPDSAVQYEAQHSKDSFFSAADERASFFQPKPAHQAPSRPNIQRQCAACAAEEKQGKEEEHIDKKPEIQKMSAFDSDADAGEDNVQTKLKIGRPGDRYEQEADAMAEKVASSAAAVHAGVQAKRNGHSASNDTPDISAQFKLPEVKEMEPVPPENKEQTEENAKNLEKTAEAKEEGKTKGEAAKEKKKPAVEMPERKKPEGEEDAEAPGINARFNGNADTSGIPSIQKTDKAGGNASSDLQTSLKGSKGGGRNLEPDVQLEMEGHFGRDLSGVRIHTGNTAVQMNHDLDARAFTNEQDIYFNSGEYDPAAPEGKKLLAHELTHTVQQGGEGGTIQRWAAAPQTVTTEGKAEKPNDGAEVEGKVNNKIDNDDRVKDQDDLDDDEKEKAKKPDRGEVRSEKAVVKGSGISAPPVDRGAVAQDKIEGEKAEMNAQLAKNTPEGKQGGGEGAGKTPELSAADAAAQKAQTAQQKAQAVVIPEKPEPFKHPRIEQPKDSAGKALPVNDKIDTQVRGLGMIGEALRDYGYESKRHAAEQEIQAHAIQAVNEKLREDLANAKEGTNTIEAHTEERKELSQLSKEAHQESTERQQFVAEKGPDMANKAKEGSADSGALAGDAKGKAEQSQSETPEDEDAQADAEAQNGQMNEVADGSVSMDKAIQQSEERANQYTADAAEAAEKNQQADAQVKETDEVIAKTDARIAELHGKNAVTEAKTNEVAPGPDLIRKFSKEQARSGEDIIAVSILMEQEINTVQEQYLADMAAIESREAAEKRILEELEKGQGEQKLSPEEQILLELSGLSDEELQQRLSEMDPAQRELLTKKLEELQATAEPETEGQDTEAAPAEKPEGGGDPGDPRGEKIQEVENRRIEGLQGPLDVADNHMTLLPADQQMRIANALVAASFTDKVKNIDVLQMGKEMIKGMINPLTALSSIKGGWDKLTGGLAGIGNLEAWKKDPLGQLLQTAASISTGLAMIFSSILGIAGTITALMVVLTIVSWGFLSPVTAPVIAWMGTVMSFAGWGAIIAGGLSVYFNYLAYLKNLSDAGTAPTARALFAETEDMKKNAADGLTGAMAVVEGVGAVKMGPSMKSGEFFKNVPKSPGQFASKTAQAVKGGAVAIAKAPGKAIRGIKNLIKGGKKGLINLKDKIKNFFSKKKGRPDPADIDVTSPQGRAKHQNNLDEARSKDQLKDLDQQQLNAENIEARKNKPREVDDPDLVDEYDIEVKSNEHTYRRRKDGKGWCRFSSTPGPKDCLIGDPFDIDEDFGNPHVDDDKFDDVFDDTPENIEAARRDALRAQGGKGAIADADFNELGDFDICFPSGVLIKSTLGSIPIEKIQVGCEVYSYNFLLKEQEVKTVAKTFTTHPKHSIVISLNREDIQTTGAHPFWVENLGAWVPAKLLRKGMFLRKSDDTLEKIIGVRFEENNLTAYNFSVNENENYYVGNSGILVHNSSGPGSAFANPTKKHTAFYRLFDKTTGKYIYVGQTEVKSGLSPKQSIDKRLSNGHRVKQDQPWKSILNEQLPDGSYRVESHLIGDAEMSKLEAAITERSHVMKNGGFNNLENVDEIINKASYDAHKHRFNTECI